ncbi:hypothetical protein [Sphingomonas melonis]|uniref:Uncharacterized protein n=1 Tax=Sphingomonas melonis TaxID=152682 RepID=A0A7Y9JZF2_9SPHN|nr:hypothetical protein [Sphingomonas melonis]NYD88743.1 hypothetical protein [Sphingomonas melonis]
MAKQYKILTPDGQTMTVEGPEDATDDELISFAQEQLKTSGSKFAGRQTVVDRPVAQPTIAPEAQAPVSPETARLQRGQDALSSGILGKVNDVLGGGGIRHLLDNGAMLGLGDEISGLSNAAYNVLSSPFTGHFAPVEAYYGGRDAERAQQDAAREKSPISGTLAEIAGGFVGLNPTAAIATAPNALAAIRSGAKGGAILGGVAGFGGGRDAETSLTGGVLGGAFGGVLGAAAPVVASNVARTARGYRRFFGRDPNVALDVVGDALAADANTGAQAGAIMDRGHSLGVPVMLADTGENARALVASVGRQPGPSRTTVLNAVQERQLGQADRIRGAIERDLGPLSNQPDRAAAFRAQDRATAAEARERALTDLTQTAEGIGPNVDRLASGSQAREAFGTAYDAARSRSREAYNAPELVNPQPIEIPAEVFSRDMRSAADDFYGDGGGEMPATLRSIIDDAAAPDATTRTLTNIDRRLADFGGEATMSGNRSDAAFATRLRGILSDFADRAAPQPYRAALANAKSVRAEQGRLFETRDLPRTFANDRFGNPIVGDTSVPERLVRPGAPGGDTADSLIAAVGPDQAEAIMRQELRRNLDSMADLTPANTRALNTRYAEAVQRFPALADDLAAVNRHAATLTAAANAEQLAGREGSTAIEQGYNSLSRSPDEIGRALSTLADDQIPLFGEGLRNQLANQIGRRVDDADKARALIGTPNRRSVLERVFPNDGLDRFAETLAAEQAGNQTFRSATQGSDTAVRQAYDAQTTDPGLVEGVLDTGIRAGKDGWLSLIMSGLQKVRDTGRYGAGEAGKSVRQSIATLLTETDPSELQRILAEANAQAANRVAQDQRTMGGATQVGQRLSGGVVTGASGLGR